MKASWVTSSTSAWSRMKRDNSLPSFRWYFPTNCSNARLSPACARSTNAWSISRSLIICNFPVSLRFVITSRKYSLSLDYKSARQGNCIKPAQVRGLSRDTHRRRLRRFGEPGLVVLDRKYKVASLVTDDLCNVAVSSHGRATSGGRCGSDLAPSRSPTEDTPIVSALEANRAHNGTSA